MKDGAPPIVEQEQEYDHPPAFTVTTAVKR